MTAAAKKYRRAPVNPANAVADAGQSKVLASVRDPENPYARYFTRGRSFAELLPRKSAPESSK